MLSLLEKNKGDAIRSAIFELFFLFSFDGGWSGQ